MKISEIKSCFVGPALSPEHFIAEHFFVFVAEGTMNGYDGNKHQILKAGESCIVRKNRLARYNKVRANGEFEKVYLDLGFEDLSHFSFAFKKEFGASATKL
jgi:hypothetical protein